MKKKILLLSFLIVIISSCSAQITCALADTPPIGEEVTISWISFYSKPNLNSYYEITVTWTDSEETHSQTYPGWCADSGVYVASSPYQAILIPSNDLPDDEQIYSDDEQWCKINYLMNQWSAKAYTGASWVDIQQVIWYYSDAGYTINSVPPKVSDTTTVWTIIADVDDNAPEDCDYPEYAIISVPKENPANHQLIFFMIPEIPLGTIGAFLSMFSAYMIKRRKLT